MTRIDPVSRLLLGASSAARLRDEKGPVVLMYHSLAPGRGMPDSRWSVSAAAFGEQMHFLRSEGWTTACVRDLPRADALPPRTVVITFDDGYADNFEHGFEVLAKNGMRATWFIVSRHIGKTSSWTGGDPPARPLLSLSQLREMMAQGMEIGSHTRGHARLTELDREGVGDEVAGSREELEEMLGSSVTSFAYPHGLYNEESVDAARSAGYDIACTTETGWFRDAPDPWRVGRVAVFAHDTLSSFARKLAFADTEVKWRQVAGKVWSGIAGKR